MLFTLFKICSAFFKICWQLSRADQEEIYVITKVEEDMVVKSTLKIEGIKREILVNSCMN